MFLTHLTIRTVSGDHVILGGVKGGPWSRELLGDGHKLEERPNLKGGPQTPLHTMTPMGARPGLGIQPRYEAPCDL